MLNNTTGYSRSHKKKLGAFYTPPQLAALIADESLNAWLNNHSDTEKKYQFTIREKLVKGYKHRYLIKLIEIK